MGTGLNFLMEHYYFKRMSPPKLRFFFLKSFLKIGDVYNKNVIGYIVWLVSLWSFLNRYLNTNTHKDNTYNRVKVWVNIHWTWLGLSTDITVIAGYMTDMDSYLIRRAATLLENQSNFPMFKSSWIIK